MLQDTLIEKLARRCEEASDALQAAQHEDPGGDEVDFCSSWSRTRASARRRAYAVGIVGNHVATPILKSRHRLAANLRHDRRICPVSM